MCVPPPPHLPTLLPQPAHSFNDSEHFKDPDLYSDKSDRENEQESENEGLEKSEESDSDTSERQDDSYMEPEPMEVLQETPYTEQSHEELGEVSRAPHGFEGGGTDKRRPQNHCETRLLQTLNLLCLLIGDFCGKCPASITFNLTSC